MGDVRALFKSAGRPGLEMVERPEPETGVGEVKVRVLRTGICGTDLHIHSWDRWAQTAQLAEPEARSVAIWAIQQAALAAGIVPSSVQELYLACAAGAWSGRTVPAMNLRGWTYQTCRAVFRAAKELDSKLFIFEQAVGEALYAQQPPLEYAAGVLAAALREGHVGPVFLQADNLINVLQTMSEIALLVLAQTMILIVKKMDLSLESTMGLAPGVAAWLVVPTGAGHGLGLLPGAWAIPVTLAVGALIGVINALLIIRFGLNGFIVTLGMLIVLRGVLTGISGGQTFFQLPQSMHFAKYTLWEMAQPYAGHPSFREAWRP